MDVVKGGILPGSSVYFHTHSALARELFFYPLCVGHFLCDETYEVSRNSYNSFLALYVEAGSGIVRQQGRDVPLQPGSLALIDCYEPHFYATRSGWEIYWLHFDGHLARRYFELCTQGGAVFEPEIARSCARYLHRLFFLFREQGAPNEAGLSRRITDLLTDLMLPAVPEGAVRSAPGVVEETISYLTAHLEETIRLEELSQRVSLSPFYFSRLFKRETGYSPHEYLVRARMDRARYLLKSTSLTVKEIAFSTGFSSECGFCTTFKKWCGSTPSQYRNDGM